MLLQEKDFIGKSHSYVNSTLGVPDRSEYNDCLWTYKTPQPFTGLGSLSIYFSEVTGKVLRCRFDESG